MVGRDKEEPFMEREEAFFWEKYSGNVVVTRELAAFGDFRVKLVVAERAILIGRGSVGALICDECVLSSMGGPISVNMLKARSALLMGGRHPVVVTQCEAGEGLYAYRSLIGNATGRTIVMGAMSSIKRLEHFARLIFVDPHSYIEDIESWEGSDILIY